MLSIFTYKNINKSYYNQSKIMLRFLCVIPTTSRFWRNVTLSSVSTCTLTSSQHPIKHGHWCSLFVSAWSCYSDPTSLWLTDLLLMFLMTPFLIIACLFPYLTLTLMPGLFFVLSCTKSWFFLCFSCPELLFVNNLTDQPGLETFYLTTYS